MMSYDVSLMIDTGGPEQVEVTWRNMTSNVACMWRHAGADLAEFDGRKAGEVYPLLVDAVAEMLANPGTYRAMNPPNGWGSYETCVEFLRQLAVDFGAHPNATVSVSR